MEKINNIEDGYGYQYKEVDADDKFCILNDILHFERGTIENSYYDNELMLIPDTDLGVYLSSSGYQICHFEKFAKTVETFGYPQYVEKEFYKVLDIKSLKEIVENEKYYIEIKKWLDDHLSEEQKKEWNKKIEESMESRLKNFDHYYEIDFYKNKTGRIYLENANSEEAILIDTDVNGFNLELGDIFINTDNKSFLGNILEYMIKNRALLNGIIKLENGYVFNNMYYETIEELEECIEKEIKDKKLINKFNNEGLSIEDIWVENEHEKTEAAFTR